MYYSFTVHTTIRSSPRGILFAKGTNPVTEHPQFLSPVEEEQIGLFNGTTGGLHKGRATQNNSQGLLHTAGTFPIHTLQITYTTSNMLLSTLWKLFKKKNKKTSS